MSGTTAGLPPPPTWPARVFPADIERYVIAVATSVGVPVEMVAVPMLVFAGTAIGNAVEVVLKRGYTQLPTLWAGVIADPGTAKTPAQQGAQWPINELQKAAYDRWRREMDDHEVELVRWQTRPKDDRGPKPTPPVLDHLYTTDPTLEALVDLLSRCRGMAVTRDELSGFIASFDKYRGGKGSDRQEHLSLWAGTPIKADRKTGGSVFAPHPVAGIYGGIQPDLARNLHSTTGERDGMVERFLLFLPEVEPARWTDADVDPALLVPVVATFRSLRSVSVPDGDERIRVQLSPVARKTWVSWYNENADATKQATGVRRGFYSKMPNQVARIALILHGLHNADDPRRMISDATMHDAITVGEFFRGHLDRVLPLIGGDTRGEPLGLSTRIVSYLRRDDLQDEQGWVGHSRLLHALGNVHASAMTDELARLQERGLVEFRRLETDTKPRKEWRLLTAPAPKNSNDSNYPSDGPFSASGHSNRSNSSNGLHHDGDSASDGEYAEQFLLIDGEQ